MILSAKLINSCTDETPRRLVDGGAGGGVSDGRSGLRQAGRVWACLQETARCCLTSRGTWEVGGNRDEEGQGGGGGMRRGRIQGVESCGIRRGGVESCCVRCGEGEEAWMEIRMHQVVSEQHLEVDVLSAAGGAGRASPTDPLTANI